MCLCGPPGGHTHCRIYFSWSMDPHQTSYTPDGSVWSETFDQTNLPHTDIAEVSWTGLWSVWLVGKMRAKWVTGRSPAGRGWTRWQIQIVAVSKGALDALYLLWWLDCDGNYRLLWDLIAFHRFYHISPFKSSMCFYSLKITCMHNMVIAASFNMSLPSLLCLYYDHFIHTLYVYI